MTSETIYDNSTKTLYIKYLENDQLFCLHVIDQLNNNDIEKIVFDFRDAQITFTSGLLAIINKAKLYGSITFVVNNKISEELELKKYGKVIYDN